MIELQIKGATYSSSRSTALREIRFALLLTVNGLSRCVVCVCRAQLDGCIEQVQAQLAEKRQMLHHYSALGPSFTALAAHYHSLQSEMDNKRWALQELAKS